VGLLFCVLAAVAFGLLGCASKAAEQRGCVASPLVVSVFAWATLVMLLRTAALHSGFQLPAKAVTIAVACGICAAVAYLAFQTSIKTGKVTVGWLMMNLSSGVPAAVSIWIYKERLSPIKIIAFALGLASVLCLFWGQRSEGQEAANTSGERG
jgi:drug/metabolite transporter (DMT)-like permease